MNVLPDDAPRPREPGDFPPSGPNSLASFGQRAAARLIDWAIIGIPAMLIVFAFATVKNNQAQFPSWSAVPFVVMMIAYEVALVTWTGQTLGKMLLGVRVARLVNGTQPDATQATMRALVPISVVVLPLYLAICYPFVYLTALYTPMRRGIHDSAAGTVVVRTR